MWEPLESHWLVTSTIFFRDEFCALIADLLHSMFNFVLVPENNVFCSMSSSSGYARILSLWILLGCLGHFGNVLGGLFTPGVFWSNQFSLLRFTVSLHGLCLELSASGCWEAPWKYSAWQGKIPRTFTFGVSYFPEYSWFFSLMLQQPYKPLRQRGCRDIRLQLSPGRVLWARVSLLCVPPGKGAVTCKCSEDRGCPQGWWSPPARSSKGSWSGGYLNNFHCQHEKKFKNAA